MVFGGMQYVLGVLAWCSRRWTTRRRFGVSRAAVHLRSYVAAYVSLDELQRHICVRDVVAVTYAELMIPTSAPKSIYDTDVLGCIVDGIRV